MTNQGKESERYQAQLVDWLKRHQKDKHTLTWEELDAKPQTYEQFISDFTVWSKKMKSTKGKLKKLKQNQDINVF